MMVMCRLTKMRGHLLEGRPTASINFIAEAAQDFLQWLRTCLAFGSLHPQEETGKFVENIWRAMAGNNAAPRVPSYSLGNLVRACDTS